MLAPPGYTSLGPPRMISPDVSDGHGPYWCGGPRCRPQTVVVVAAPETLRGHGGRAGRLAR